MSTATSLPFVAKLVLIDPELGFDNLFKERLKTKAKGGDSDVKILFYRRGCNPKLSTVISVLLFIIRG